MKKFYVVRKGNKTGIFPGEWEEVQDEIKEAISGYPNPEWKSFKSEKEAEAYLKNLPEEELDSEQQAAQENSNASEEEWDDEDKLAAEFKFTADAVVFVDGSRNFDDSDFEGGKSDGRRKKNENFYYGAYGIIIFFRDGSVYVESARMEDVDAEEDTKKDPEKGCISVARHSHKSGADRMAWEESHETVNVPYYYKPGKPDKKYVLSSWNIPGEVGAARRALDICFHQENLNSAYVFYDCEQVNIVKKILRGTKPTLSANVTYDYGEFSKILKEENKHVGAMHVYSHSKAKKKGIRCDEHLELFNSCVDALAKAETYNKPINAELNKPLVPYGRVQFPENVIYSDDLTEEKIAQKIDQRREHAFALIKKVLADPKARPEFVPELVRTEN
jgi:hypothetical protein